MHSRLEKLSKLRQKLVGFVLLVVAVGLLTATVLGLARVLPSLDAQVLAALVAAIGAFVGFILNQRSLRKREIAEAHRPQKTRVYEQFMTTVVGLMRATGGSQSATSEFSSGETAELEEFFFSFTKDLIVWGAPNVILSFQRFKTGAVGRSAVENLLAVDDILWAFGSTWVTATGGFAGET